MRINKLFRRRKSTEQENLSDDPPSSLEEEVLIFEQSFASPPTLEFRGEIDLNNSHILMEYQMTVQPKVKLSGKEASILLMALVTEAVQEGIDFTGYLTMEWLYFFLTKGGTLEVTAVQIEKARKTVMLSELILIVCRATWLNLSEREQLPLEVKQKIISTGWLPDKRTLGSWNPIYQVRKYFEARAVRLDTFLETERNSERYSSYTKGYGEGGKLSRRLKTPHSFELDGDSEERPESVRYNLTELATYSDILTSIEVWKNRNKGEQ
jgi:hypothetical protein